MSASPLQIAKALEYGLIFSGAWLIWRIVLSPSARAERKPANLAPWNITITDFLFFLWLVFIGGFAVPLVISQLLKGTTHDTAHQIVILTAAFHFGLFAGVASFRIFFHREQTAAFRSTLHPAISGCAVFLISLPIVHLVSFLWQNFLNFVGLPPESQSMIHIFSESKSHVLLWLISALATLVVPVTEELIFRAGLFRFARTRLPRWAALIFPATLFGALHELNLASFAPLFALGIIFSLAYERTGRIATTMIAHGLFNLNTVVLILCGVTS